MTERPHAARTAGSRTTRLDNWPSLTSSAWRPFLEHSPAAQFLRRHNGAFIWTNAAYRRLICGTAEADLAEQMLEDLLPEGFAHQYRELDNEVNERGRHLYSRVPFPRSGSAGTAVGYRFLVDTHDQGACIGGAYVDVSDLDEFRQRWSQADISFRAVFAHAAAPTAILDVDGQITDTNAALCGLFRLPHSALFGRAPEDLLDMDDAQTKDVWRQLKTGRRTRARLTVTGRRASGSRFRARMTSTLVRRPDGTPSLMACTFDAVCEMSPGHTPLTRTETELLLALAAGASNTDLQQRLMLARQTVDYHLANLRAKLGAESRAAIVGRAYATGVLEPGCWPPRAYGES
ncbi:PAS domain S-box protein [Streptomyces sp. NPDC099088]|uniref:PAS domain S-box protein n=1 Tax=Streptomyces sp. NPDC099088 TaxID=3366101 RepID=UPI0038001EAE